MAENKPYTPVVPRAQPAKAKIVVVDDSPIFSKANFLLMGIGAVIIIIGVFIMAGGKSTDPKVFDYKEVYSTTRITVAPILIILGILVEVYAIFKKSTPAE